MSIHRLLAPLCLLATLSSYGCDDNGRTDDRVDRIGPSAITFNSRFGESAINSTGFFSRSVTLQTTVITPQRITGAACPTRPPFLAPIRILARGNGQSDLFVSQVQMRFVDRTGVFGGWMTIAQPQIVELLGSTRIPPLGTRSFPLSFPFGCIGQPAGTLTVVVFTADSSGHEVRTPLSMSVR
jgi:hypothetical protein